MVRIIFSVLTMLAVASSSFSEGPYLLHSELTTTFASSTTFRLTTYFQENHGKFSEALAYLKGDTISGLDNATLFAYDAKQRLVSKIVLKSGVDTSTVVTFSYDVAGNMAEMKTKIGTVGAWQIDSFKYDANQRLLGKYHYATANYYRHYSYDASGNEIADTMYEASGATFVPTQASIFDYSVSNVVTQNDFFSTGTDWFPKLTTVTTYLDAKRIASIATYSSNGAKLNLADSLSYAYDSLGNKSKVTHFDKNGTRTYTTDFTWIPNPYDAIITKAPSEKRFMELAYSKRNVIISHAENVMGTLAVYTLSGKLIKKEMVLAGQKYSMALPGLTPGKYIAAYSAGGVMQSLVLNIGN